MKTYIYRTTDLGKTWLSITTPELIGYAHKIKQDIVNPNLLFAGTVFGLYISIDGGVSWVLYNANVPPAEVRDIAIHPVTHDLIIATHGRGVLIVDDLTGIRSVNNELLNSEASFMPVRENYIYGGFLNGSFPNQAGTFTGTNSTEDAVIMYYLKDRIVTGDVKVDIYDASGSLIKSLPGTKRKGINKITWDMRVKPPKVAKGVKPDFSGFVSPFVPEGTYKMVLTAGSRTIEGILDLKIHPLCKHSRSDITLQYESSMKLLKMHEDLAFIVENILKVQKDAQKMIDESKGDENTAKELIDKLEEIRVTLVATKEGRITGEERLREKLGDVYTNIAFYNGKPSESYLSRIPGIEKEIAEAKAKTDAVYTKYLTKLNIVLMTREQFDKMSQ